MRGPDIEDYLNQGIHGPLETKPNERRRFLGTLRERVVIALTKVQMREAGIYPEVEKALKEYPKATMLLNGRMDYSHLSKYTKLAQKYHVKTSIVTNKDYDSELGLVLCAGTAIDKEDIYIKKAGKPAVKQEKAAKKGLLSIFGGIFKK